MRELASQSPGLWSQSKGDWIQFSDDYRMLSREVHAVALDAAARDDWKEVVEGVLDLTAIAAALDTDVHPTASIIRVYPEELAIGSLLPRLAGHPIGETNWVRIQERLARSEGVPSLQRSQLGNQLSRFDMIEQMSGKMGITWMEQARSSKPWWEAGRGLFGIPAISGRRLDEELERFAQLCRPFPECLQAVDVVIHQHLKIVPGSTLQVPIGMIMDWSELHEACRLLRVRFGVALCAVERFRLLETGVVPNDLVALTTGPSPLLSKVPLDPFTGNSRVSEPKENGYVLRRSSALPSGVVRVFVESSLDQMELKVLPVP